MENNRKNNLDTQVLAEGLQQLAQLSLTSLKSTFETSLRNISEVNKVMTNMRTATLGGSRQTKKEDCGCCPTKQECPPHCLIQISRHAFAGERVMVPFVIKNTHNTPRHFKVGVRELKMDDGSLAPSQPILNKTEVTLDPGESEMVLMSVDLIDFSPGHTYNTEIVIREKDINQNICFNLVVDGYYDVPVAAPLDEHKYLLHWQGWQSHFYCEPVQHQGKV